MYGQVIVHPRLAHQFLSIGAASDQIDDLLASPDHERFFRKRLESNIVRSCYRGGSMPSMVFISHSSKDREIADAICAHLESAGIKCWIAPRDIEPGATWTQ